MDKKLHDYRLTHKETLKEEFFDLSELLYFCSLGNDLKYYYVDEKLYILYSVMPGSRWADHVPVYTNDIICQDVGNTVLEWVAQRWNNGLFVLRRPTINSRERQAKVVEQFYDDTHRYWYYGSLYSKSDKKLLELFNK